MNNITPEEAHEIIKAGNVIVVDVRTPEEFESGHIPGAQNINIHDDAFEKKVCMLDPGATYIINCQSGGRSSRATIAMEKLGFSNVKNLLGGITAWGKANLPVD